MSIQIPDELARGLEGTASAQKAVLRSVRGLPDPSAAATGELEAAILSGRLPVREEGAFDGRTTV